MFAELLDRFPQYTIDSKPTGELLERYRSRVPPELLEVWEQYGFGTFRDGYLKIVNPDDYAELLTDTYQLTSTPAAAAPVVLFATAMADLLIWEDGYLSHIDYRHGQTQVLAKSLQFFFKDLTDDETLSEEMLWEP